MAQAQVSYTVRHHDSCPLVLGYPELVVGVSEALQMIVECFNYNEHAGFAAVD